MKTVKGIITILLIIFGYMLSYAQQVQVTPAQWLEEHKKEMNNTPYIFEGTVTQQNHYNGTKQAITTCILQITKIFKGNPQLNLGTIKVVTWQGAPVINGMMSGSTSDEGYMVPIGKGGTYIIFGRIVGSGWCVDSTVTDNSVTLTTWGTDYSIVISKDSVSWYGTPQFKTKEDIYSFFQENGVSIQEQATPSDSTKH